MRRLTSIVAVNKQGVIGLGNALPWRVKSDLRFFREQTENNVVIMGRKTYDSLGKCLPRRFNVVVSHSFSLFPSTPDCQLQNSIGESLMAAERAPQRYKEIYIIGGASMYQQFASMVDRYLVTIVDKVVHDGDAFFDQSLIGDLENWDRKKLLSGDCNNDGDEASFAIFELNAREPELRRAARQEFTLRGDKRSSGATVKQVRTPVPEPQRLTLAFG